MKRFKPPVFSHILNTAVCVTSFDVNQEIVLLVYLLSPFVSFFSLNHVFSIVCLRFFSFLLLLLLGINCVVSVFVTIFCCCYS